MAPPRSGVADGRDDPATSRGCTWRTPWCRTPPPRGDRPAPSQGRRAAPRVCGRRGGRAPTSTSWSAPDDFARSRAALEARGWEPYSGLETGSAFKHAANWWHPRLGVRRPARPLAGGDGRPARRRSPPSPRGARSARSPTVRARCPGPDAQLLVLLLHAARTQDSVDVEFAWTRQPEERRVSGPRPGRPPRGPGGAGRRDRRARGLPRRPALSAVALLQQRRRPPRRVAGALSIGHHLARARRACSSCAARVNRDHLRIRLGRTPTRRELRHAQLSRLATLARELRHRAVGRRTP